MQLKTSGRGLQAVAGGSQGEGPGVLGRGWGARLLGECTQGINLSFTVLFSHQVASHGLRTAARARPTFPGHISFILAVLCSHTSRWESGAIQAKSEQVSSEGTQGP